MRQGIVTKYLGPSNFRGSRIKALARKKDSWGAEMALTDHYASAMSSEENHARVAQLLATKLEWSGLWVAGGSPDNTGNMYVNVCDAYEGAPTDSIGREGKDWFYVPAAPKKTA